MGVIPEGMPKYNDLIDIVIESAKIRRELPQIDGTILVQTEVDSEVIWCKTGSVSSNTFSREILELKEWERMATDAYDYMTKERGNQYSRQILAYGQSVRRSIDAKSSESVRDKNNSTSTLIDKINSNIAHITSIISSSQQWLWQYLLNTIGVL